MAWGELQGTVVAPGVGAHRVICLLTAGEGGQLSQVCSVPSNQRTSSAPAAAVTADGAWTGAASVKSSSSVVTAVCSGCPGEGATSCLGWTCTCFVGLLCCCLEPAASGPLQRFCMPEDNRLKHIGCWTLCRGWLLPALQGWPDGPGGAAAAGGQWG